MTEAPILRLITRLNIGGPARHALLLTREIGEEFPTVLAAGTPPEEEGELSHPGVFVTRVPLVRPVQPLDDIAALRAVRNLIRRHRPQLVHTHTAKAGTVGRVAALSRSRKTSRPVTVHTFHGHVLEGYFRPSVQHAFVTAERFLAAQTDALVAVSTEIRDQLLDLGIGQPDQWRVVPLGLELDEHFATNRPSGALRSQIGVAPGVPLVGFIGRLAPVKDVPTLFRAIALLHGVHLAVLGDGELREQLEKEAARLKIGERVHFTGWWRDMPSALSDLDVVALTSRNEGTPVSLIEALACRVPVVASDVGGVRSVVQDGSNGYLAPAGDVRGVAERVEALLGDAALRERFGEAGRAHVRSSFTGTRLVSDMRALYRELLGVA